eukprot:756805-Hanusia_phi.AAC.7
MGQVRRSWPRRLRMTLRGTPFFDTPVFPRMDGGGHSGMGWVFNSWHRVAQPVGRSVGVCNRWGGGVVPKVKRCGLMGTRWFERGRRGQIQWSLRDDAPCGPGPGPQPGAG